MTDSDGRVSAEALVAHNLRHLRKAMHLSQEHIADAMTERGFKMHQTQVAKIENGSRPIRLDEAMAIADILSIPPLAFISEAVVGAGDREFDLLQARFRVDAAEADVERLMEQHDEAVQHLEAERRRLRQLADDLGLDTLPPPLRGLLAPYLEEESVGEHPEAPER
ncbi:helix-turn-helix domain-containing protein [Yinghuangia sp. ASG 101]|uniref:helix-turn-helix domain-containing protein n=1 Tax=Yinghuangia sp. ASG 101 TaxID=2896848 RepID=UPI001E4477E7|nr:helix-turn-helix transcriptional regulator [Yinghuangia sp. ASG 101]UGQ14330.1 helix-turn-helix domain-containing protein [Yinghuangia sp. ASG 101]